MQYRRSKVNGGTYFFTINLFNRKSSLLIDKFTKLRKALNKVKIDHPFILDAMVVLPDHLHMLMTLPQGDDDYPVRLRLIKAGFSRQISHRCSVSQSRKNKNERGIWQRRYWEHCIRDENDMRRHIDYIHYNPIKHGYVINPTDWKYSTIHKYIDKGLLDKNWANKKLLDLNLNKPIE